MNVPGLRLEAAVATLWSSGSRIAKKALRQERRLGCAAPPNQVKHDGVFLSSRLVGVRVRVGVIK